MSAHNKKEFRPVLLIGLALLSSAAMCSAAVCQDLRDRDDTRSSFPGDERSLQPRYLPPGSNNPTNYRLGVTVRNTETGVLINSVQPGSPASRAGLEAGDTIVTVGGYQVGYVESRLFDLGDEIARRVDTRGQVTLLVRNRRNGNLVNVPVSFSGNSGGGGVLSVSGVVSIRDRITPSRNAILTLRLLDITHNHWQHVPVQTINLRAPRTWPMEYQLDVNANKVTPGHRYAIEAEVKEGVRTILETVAPVPLAGSRRVDLVLVASKQRPGGLPFGQNGGLPFEQQIQQWYQQYLSRPATAREVSAWQLDIQRGKSMDDIQAGILSSSEYFERNNSDRDGYVRELYGELSGREPSGDQQRELREQLEKQKDVRLRFAQELMRQLKANEKGNDNSPGRDR